MTTASPVWLTDRECVKQSCNPFLGSRQFPTGLVQLLLQALEFGADVPRPGCLGVTHVCAAVRPDVNEPLGLEHPEGGGHRVARDSVPIFKLPVRRELRTARVLPALYVCAELTGHPSAVAALLVYVRHSVIVPSWLTPKLLTKRLSYNYCHKPINCYAPVDSTDGPEMVPGLQPPPGATQHRRFC